MGIRVEPVAGNHLAPPFLQLLGSLFFLVIRGAQKELNKNTPKESNSSIIIIQNGIKLNKGKIKVMTTNAIIFPPAPWLTFLSSMLDP